MRSKLWLNAYESEDVMVKHISYNPKLELAIPLDLIPDGYMLEKVVYVSEYEFVMVCV